MKGAAHVEKADRLAVVELRDLGVDVLDAIGKTLVLARQQAQQQDFRSRQLPLQRRDDGLDAVAYVDQMSTASYVDVEDISEWQALDPVAGY